MERRQQQVHILSTTPPLRHHLVVALLLTFAWWATIGRAKGEEGAPTNPQSHVFPTTAIEDGRREIVVEHDYMRGEHWIKGGGVVRLLLCNTPGEPRVTMSPPGEKSQEYQTDHIRYPGSQKSVKVSWYCHWPHNLSPRRAFAPGACLFNYFLKRQISLPTH
jgi:hypothetical protein